VICLAEGQDNGLSTGLQRAVPVVPKPVSEEQNRVWWGGSAAACDGVTLLHCVLVQPCVPTSPVLQSQRLLRKAFPAHCSY